MFGAVVLVLWFCSSGSGFYCFGSSDSSSYGLGSVVLWFWFWFCGSYLAGFQDVDLLLVDGVSVLLQEAFTLILHLWTRQ